MKYASYPGSLQILIIQFHRQCDLFIIHISIVSIGKGIYTLDGVIFIKVAIMHGAYVSACFLLYFVCLWHVDFGVESASKTLLKYQVYFFSIWMLITLKNIVPIYQISSDLFLDMN